MPALKVTMLLFLMPFIMVLTGSSSASELASKAVQLALQAVIQAKVQVAEEASPMGLLSKEDQAQKEGPWADCLKLYGNSEDRILRLVTAGAGEEYSVNDRRAWLSGAMASHDTCMDGLRASNVSILKWKHREVEDQLTSALSALAMHNQESYVEASRWNETATDNSGLLTSWDASAQNAADIVVAQDGSGQYTTINQAVVALHQRGPSESDSRRIVVYIKAGVYTEYVEISRKLRNIMFVGDGIERTIVTGSHNVPDGYTTYGSATFRVSADGFWARDMTFENTAGPQKHQAVAITVESDHSIFYRCSFKAYQDTLFVHSLRQFYRDCHIYGTIDFIFGNAAVVIQNCEIFIRKPMDHQANMITAQGRGDPNQNTGISVHSSRVRPASDLEPVKGSFKSYLGRPWQKYSRTVFLKTDIDGLINPEGWSKWSGEFALDTLYYGEYMNSGDGASVDRRVKWPGFHVLTDYNEAGAFNVERFIQGNSWIPESGAPFWSEI